MTDPEPSGHVTRAETRELLARLNEYERIVPIYQQALELIAHTNGGGPWAIVADRALREALRR
jgi:hypothetical protein